MTFAALKRRLQVGAKIEMVRHDYQPGGAVPEKLRGVREVARVQSNAVQFSGGSWLYWPKAAEVRADDKGFDVALMVNNDPSNRRIRSADFSVLMRYEFR